MSQVEAWEVIFNYVAPVDCAKCESVCKQWQQCLANRNKWWQKKCWQDYSLMDILGPASQHCSTYKQAYGLWYNQFCDLDVDLVRRACTVWSTLKKWQKKLTANDCFFPGLTKMDVDNIQESSGIVLPQCVQAVYRLHNGCCGEFGLLGGYDFYDHMINLRLDSLVAAKDSVIHTILGTDHSWQLIISTSFPVSMKFVTVDCSTGDVSIPMMHTPAYWWPANPRGGTGKKDGFLCWLEEYVRRLQNSYYAVEICHNIPRVSLFPRNEATTFVAVTRGIQVKASIVFVPELSYRGQAHNQFIFTYSITFKMLEETPEFKKAQLVNRCWTIVQDENEQPQRVEGPGVIGKHPIVSMDSDEFVYQSCTDQKKNGGYMYGHFDFIQGTIDRPTGPMFQVQCPKFDLIIPQYIY
eukprot:TRINITY_DN21002_c0_g1_i1.p1 TRINITY_DN21002_c0_g1~~TRINITY_DN21002_c0_g1_i1.p1  ORF type:complete len:444 (-),score=45.48 TRINITY_DN21002_c0_g1_i1:367-1593(-)